MQNAVQFYPARNRGTQPPTRPWQLIFANNFVIMPSMASAVTVPPKQQGPRLEGNMIVAGEPVQFVLEAPAVGGVIGLSLGSAVDANIPQATVRVADLNVSERVTRERLHEVFRLLTQEPGRVTSTEARQRFAELSEWSAQNQRPVLVTNHGRNELVILPFSLFQRVLKGIAREILGFRSRRSYLSDRAEEILEGEAESINQRLRQRRDD